MIMCQAKAGPTVFPVTQTVTMSVHSVEIGIVPTIANLHRMCALLTRVSYQLQLCALGTSIVLLC